jgi:hypothetical protein
VVTAHHLVVIGQGQVHLLDRNRAADDRVARQVNETEAPATEHALDDVFAI